MYHVFVALLQPQIICFILIGATIAHMWWKRRESRRRLLLLTVPFLVLVLCCLPVVSYLALGTLEWQQPPLEERPAGTEAIVVLGGYAHAPDGIRKQPELGTDTVYRCLKAAELYHQGKRCPILVCGGSSGRNSSGPALAPLMKDFLRKLGVMADDVIVEDTSLTTHENAVEAAKLLNGRGLHRVLLVTDATHLEPIPKWPF
jgi:uncharacterized SAM-binding protein YcdF (DUF218 family)